MTDPAFDEEPMNVVEIFFTLFFFAALVSAALAIGGLVGTFAVHFFNWLQTL